MIFWSWRRFYDLFTGLLSALNHIAELLERLGDVWEANLSRQLELTEQVAQTHARFAEWEANMEALYVRADQKLKASMAAEARARRHMARAREDDDDGVDEDAGDAQAHLFHGPMPGMPGPRSGGDHGRDEGTDEEGGPGDLEEIARRFTFGGGSD